MSTAAALAAWVMAECGAVDVEVEWLGLTDAIAAEVVGFDGQPCRRTPQLRARVGEGRTTTFRPKLVLWTEGPVAAEDVAAGGIVRTQTGRVRLDGRVGRPVHAGTARVAIRAGEPVTDAVVSPTPDLLRGAAVQLHVTRGSLLVKADGRLLEDAVFGDRVRVVGPTKQVLQGVLTESSVVEIR